MERGVGRYTVIGWGLWSRCLGTYGDEAVESISVRGRRKVNTQWLLFCVMHNIGKIQRYGMQAG